MQGGAGLNDGSTRLRGLNSRPAYSGSQLNRILARTLRSVLRLWYFFGSLSLIFLRAETAMSSRVRPAANTVGETPNGPKVVGHGFAPSDCVMVLAVTSRGQVSISGLAMEASVDNLKKGFAGWKEPS